MSFYFSFSHHFNLNLLENNKKKKRSGRFEKFNNLIQCIKLWICREISNNSNQLLIQIDLTL